MIMLQKDLRKPSQKRKRRNNVKQKFISEGVWLVYNPLSI